MHNSSFFCIFLFFFNKNIYKKYISASFQGLFYATVSSVYTNMNVWDSKKHRYVVTKMSLTEYEQNKQNMSRILFFPTYHQKVQSSLLSALLCTWCAERVCVLLADVFLAFHTGVAGLGVISAGTDLAPATFSCLQFEALEELRDVSLLGCPSQELQQLLMLLEGTVFSRYEVSPARNPAAPGKSSLDSVFRCFSPCLFHSMLQKHCKRSHQWCWRKWQGANEQSCVGICMWLWPRPGY